MGPSSSGSQATVASVVTSTLLAGLGFGGGGISSFPSTVWPTRLPTAAAASKQAGRPVLATTEALASPGPDGDSAPTKDSEGAEEGEKEEKSESEDGEREHEEEGEKDSERKEKSEATHTAEERNRTAPAPTPSSPHRTTEEGGHQTISGHGQDHTGPATDQPGQVVPGLDPNEDTATQVPPTAAEEHYSGSDPRRPEMPSKKPMSRGDRFSEDSKFITVNPGRWCWPTFEGPGCYEQTQPISKSWGGRGVRGGEAGNTFEIVGIPGMSVPTTTSSSLILKGAFSSLE